MVCPERRLCAFPLRLSASAVDAGVHSPVLTAKAVDAPGAYGTAEALRRRDAEKNLGG